MIKKSPRACQIFCNASAAFFRYDCIAYLPTDSVPSVKIDYFHKNLLFFYIRDNGKWVEGKFNWHFTVVMGVEMISDQFGLKNGIDLFCSWVRLY